MNFRIYKHPEKLPAPEKGSVVAIGNFDGVHKGHQAVISSAKKQADALGVPLIILTFDPHPREVLVPQKAPMRLTPLEEKCDLLARYGAEGVYVIPFSLAYAKTSARAFIEETLTAALGAKLVVVGADFAFGRNREGDVETLKKAGGFDVEALPLQKGHEGVYASTAIREHIKNGDTEKARAMLGHSIERIAEKT